MNARRDHRAAEEEELGVIIAPYRLVALRRQRRNRSAPTHTRSTWLWNVSRDVGPPDGKDAA